MCNWKFSVNWPTATFRSDGCFRRFKDLADNDFLDHNFNHTSHDHDDNHQKGEADVYAGSTLGDDPPQQFSQWPSSNFATPNNNDNRCNHDNNYRSRAAAISN